jgi:hypothetical protein
MPTNYRMLPPAVFAGQPAIGQQSMTVNGRSYAGVPGAVLDVPDMDARILGANGWVEVCASGTTAQRPTSTSVPLSAAPSVQYWDTTLSKLVVYDGKTWRDPSNGSAV